MYFQNTLYPGQIHIFCLVKKLQCLCSQDTYSAVQTGHLLSLPVLHVLLVELAPNLLETSLWRKNSEWLEGGGALYPLLHLLLLESLLPGFD